MDKTIKHTVRKIAIKKRDGQIAVCVLNDDWKYTCSEWVDENNPEEGFVQIWNILKEDKKWTKIYEDK